ALGLLGAYIVPLRVSSEAPRALPLFAYLALVTAAALALLRHRAWWWLAWLSLAGAVLWVPVWLGAARDPEAAVVAFYLLVQFALFVAFRLGGGGFAVLPRVARSGRWAAVSAAVPLAVLVIVYWRLQKFELDIAWTLAALALAGLELGAAASVAQRRTGALEIEIALAAYAVGVLGSTIFAATLALGE